MIGPLLIFTQTKASGKQMMYRKNKLPEYSVVEEIQGK